MNNIIYQELIKKQRKNLSGDKKLSIFDLKRIASYLNLSIFTDNCSYWTGYVITSKKKSIQNVDENLSGFVNFFFRGKKHALHRLLYYNFIDDIVDSEYLKFSCKNQGKCCTLNHIVKIKKNVIENIPEIISEDKKDSKKNTIIIVEF